MEKRTMTNEDMLLIRDLVAELDYIKCLSAKTTGYTPQIANTLGQEYQKVKMPSATSFLQGANTETLEDFRRCVAEYAGTIPQSIIDRFSSADIEIFSPVCTITRLRHLRQNRLLVC